LTLEAIGTWIDRNVGVIVAAIGGAVSTHFAAWVTAIRKLSAHERRITALESSQAEIMTEVEKLPRLEQAFEEFLARDEERHTEGRRRADEIQSDLRETKGAVFDLTRAILRGNRDQE
jgi:hypothetical protein